MNANLLETLPVFNVSDYGASGSDATGTCSAIAGSTHLTCTFDVNDFKPGQGIRFDSAGRGPVSLPIVDAPVITRAGYGPNGTHTYCYRVSTADPFGSTTPASPQTCIGDEGDLALTSTFNQLVTTEARGRYQDAGPVTSFLWYVSEDGGPYQLVTVVQSAGSGASDVGQRPASRGGWPTQISSAQLDTTRNEDFFSTVISIRDGEMELADPVPSSATNLLLHHEDSDAVQRTILAADSAGGGRVQFATGIYNLFQPSFHTSSHRHSHDVNSIAWWQGFSYLYIPDNSSGEIDLEGFGTQTVLRTSPDRDGLAVLLDAGQPIAPAIPDIPVAIEDVQKGSTVVTLADPASASPQVGDDIELYSGNYSYTYDPSKPCLTGSGEPTSGHFSELNTVVGRSGETITLAYPTSKRYYDDGLNSFGLIARNHMPLQRVPHLLGLQHMTLDTYNDVYLTGNVIGMLINDIHITGSPSHGPFAGGAKRDITIQNSSWSMGAGDQTWNGSNEMDVYTNVLFANNIIVGYAAAGAEGLSTGARIYLTEGSSQFTFVNNVFENVAVSSQSSTDDAVIQNTFHNGEVNLGFAYDNNTYNYTWYHNQSYLSFASQEHALVQGNTFRQDAAWEAPVIINLGDYSDSTISNNIIENQGSRDIPVISSYGGIVENNQVTLTGSTRNSIGIALLPDPSRLGPGNPFRVDHNTITSPQVAAGILLVSPDVTSTVPVCVTANTLNVPSAQAMPNLNLTDTNAACASLPNPIQPSPAFSGLAPR